MSKLFPKLFEPPVLGGVKPNNRIMKAPQYMGLANPNGSVTEGMLQYYKQVAPSRSAMVIVEYARRLVLLRLEQVLSRICAN